MRALLLIALGLALVAPAALAEDPPTFSVETLAPQADDLQDGWTMGSGDAAADQPSADAIMEIAKAVGLSDLEVYPAQHVVVAEALLDPGQAQHRTHVWSRLRLCRR